MKRLSGVFAATITVLVQAGCGSATAVPAPRSAAVSTLPSVPMQTPAPLSLTASAPRAHRDQTVDELHGVRVHDPYRWLEDGESEQTRAYMDAYHTYSRAILDQLGERNATASRLRELYSIERRGAPIVRGKRRFFWTRAAGQERELWYVQDGDGEPRVLLDPTRLGPDANTELRGVWPSYDGKYVAYKLGFQGSDQGSVGVREVDTGKVVTEIPGTRYAQPSWNRKSTGFYYLRLPVDTQIPSNELARHMKLFFHPLGKPWADDPEIHPEPAKGTFLGGSASRDGRWLFVHQFHSYSRNDVWFRAEQSRGPFVPLAVGVDARFDYLGWGGAIFVRTNYQAPNWRLMRVDPKHPEMSRWKEIIAEEPDSVLEDVQVIGGKLALRYLKNASNRLRLTHLDGRPLRDVPLPTLGTARWFGEPEEDTATIELTSFTEPYSLYTTSVSHGGWSRSFQPQGSVDADRFTTEQVFYPSKDGTRISMFIVRPAAAARTPLPVMLTGYGGYAYSVIPRFSPLWLAWLDAGGALALPNLRGGGEYGDDWHKAGMRTKKQNVFDDFIAAAEFLIREGHTCVNQLGLEGGSNGGLLVSAALTQRPELFGAVVANVPLTDMVRFTQRGHGATWTGEYGSPEKPEEFAALFAYSPYHHVGERRRFPALLVQTADHDDRVDPMHARKLAAAVRHAQIADAPILLTVAKNAGHNGGAGVSKQIDHNTDVITFLRANLRACSP